MGKNSRRNKQTKRTLEFIDFTGVDADERARIKSILQEHDSCVQLPWVKTGTRTSRTRNNIPVLAEPRNNTETQVPDQSPDFQPVLAPTTYEHHPYPTMFNIPVLAEPRNNTETQVPDQSPDFQPVLAPTTYEHYPYPTMFLQQPYTMGQPIMAYQHHPWDAVYYGAVSPMSPQYPPFMQQSPPVHSYPYNNDYEYQQTVQLEEIIDEVVDEPQQNGRNEPEEEIRYNATSSPVHAPLVGVINN